MLYLRLTVSWLFLLMIASFTSFSQSVTGTFTDQELKPDSWVRDVFREGVYAYVGGTSSNSCGPIPLVAKVNIETGAIIWSTTSVDNINDDFDPTMDLNPTVWRVGVEGDYVYAASGSGYDNDPAALWKFDKNTGSMVWKSNFPNGAGAEAKIFHYSNRHLVVQCRYKIFLINIETGAFEKTFDDGWNTFSGVGLQQDIYLGNKLYLNFDFTAPVQTLPDPQSNPSNDSGPCYVYPVDDSKVIMFSARFQNDGIAMYDIKTNELLWMRQGYVDVGDFKIKGDHLYMGFKTPYAGGSSIRASKIHIGTGNREWEASAIYSTTYEGGSSHLGSGSVFSLDVDDAGDVYVTGDANLQNYEGDMGVMKFSGVNGSKIFEKIITDDIRDWDETSYGLEAMILNNKPYFIGNVIEHSGYVYNGSNLGNGGNNIALVRLNSTTGDIEERHDIRGRYVAPSRVQQIIPYLDGGFLTLENKGRYINVSRYDKTKDLLWSKNLKYDNFFGQNAFRIASDKAGNIAVTSLGTWVNNNSRISDSFDPQVVFLLDQEGNTVQEILLDRTGPVADLHCDGDNFYVLTNRYSATLYKINTTGIVASREISYLRVPDSHREHQLMDSKSNNELVIIGEYTGYATVSKADLSYTRFPLYSMVESYYAFQPIDMHVKDDKVYVIGQDSESFISMVCYSLTEKKVLWNGPIVHPNSSAAGYYKKMVLDNKGNIYAYGVGQYQGFLLRKINAATGAVQWTVQRSYDNDIKATDIFYDAINDRAVLTGYKLVQGKQKYMNAVFSAFGSLTMLQIDNSETVGSGLSAAVSGDGDIITGGYISDGCVTSSLTSSFTRLPSSPPVVNVTEGLDNQITVSWEGKAGSFYKVYRNTEDNVSTAEPISGWISSSSYNDVNVDRAKIYFYFVQRSRDNSGIEVSSLSTAGDGYMGFSIPVMEDAVNTSPRSIEITWLLSEGAGAYRLSRADVNDRTAAQPISGWVTDNTFTDNDVLPANVFFYFVQAAKDVNGTFQTELGEGVSNIITSTEETHVQRLLNVSPNPAKDVAMIQYESSFRGNISIVVLNSMGQTVTILKRTKDSELFEGPVDLSRLTSGYFILRLSEDGNTAKERYGRLVKR